MPPVEPIRPIQPAKPAAPACETITFRVPDTAVQQLPHTGGKDTEMGGYWRRVWASAKLRPTKRDIILSGWVRMHEEYRNGKPKYQQGPTTFRRYFERRIPVITNTACEIASISMKEGSAVGRYRDGHGTVKAYGNGIIDYADCRSDTNGNDEGRLGCRRIRFREIQIETRPATTSCPNIVIQGNNVTVDRLDHVRGDKDVHGNDPYVRIDTRVNLNGDRTRAVLQTDVEFEESKPDTTTFEGQHQRLLFLAHRDAPGCEVASVDGGTGRLRAQSNPDRRNRPQFFGAPGQRHNQEGNISSAVCWPDGPGNDEDRVFCNVSNKRITIDLRRK